MARPAIWILLTLGCLAACWNSGDGDASRGMSYSEYKNQYASTSIDPIGSSSIFYELYKSPDGWDQWWRFDLDEADFTTIVRRVATANGNADSINFENTSVLPKSWVSDSEFPDWWFGSRENQAAVISTHWCFEVDSAERHHGWFFMFDRNAQRAWCWYWNHQWSSNECVSGQ